MLGDGLSREEIAKRLVRLHNVEQMHEIQRFKIWNLRDENRALKKEIKLLKETAKAQQKTIDDLKLQMEELRAIVFGKKKKRDDGDEPPVIPRASEPRSKDSYQRKPPAENEITKTEDHPIDQCECGGAFSEKETKIYFEEDIPIPQKKTVVKHVADNNAAERSLRHLVLKRKISFGSISERTAETMAILLSVLISRKRRGELRNYLLGL